MTNEEFQKTVLEKLVSIESAMATKQELTDGIRSLDNKLDKLALSTQEDVIGMLNHIQVNTEQIDERLENIEDDINYLVKKSAKYGTDIVKLKKSIQKAFII